jgi:GH15 family glucan-1,4-alpha-glucosidase
MGKRIEDYALIGDTQTAALVHRSGSIDWLCFPRFDSPACFAELLGDDRHGRWRICPKETPVRIERRYRPGTLILETDFHLADGAAVRLVDCMPPRGQEPDVVRIVECLSGQVTMQLELIIRFDYGNVVPWIAMVDGAVRAVAGPEALYLWSSVPVRLEGQRTVAEFSLSQGQRAPFTLMWERSHHPMPPPRNADRQLQEAEAWWQEWSGDCNCRGKYHEDVRGSLIALKALTYAPTGGIVAAATTSLPEKLGGVRNWDYRFCWLRDATFTLYALMQGGYRDEAVAWRDWLLRAVAGDPSQLQIMYGAAGERRLPEQVLPWLPGFENSSPVRIGNAAVEQLQLDVFGEVMDAMYQAWRMDMEPDDDGWGLLRALLEYLETIWEQPDEGIWEVRGPRRHFTHSKVMAWVALDRAIKGADRFALKGPIERWKRVRDDIHQQVCAHGYDPSRKTFTQYYGSETLDASLLLIPLVGFLPAKDERMVSTVAAIEQNLMSGGFVHRYSSMAHGWVDGLPPGEGVFLACSFWLADNYALRGETKRAEELFHRLLALRNDVGLLSEEWNVEQQCFVGNFPQAFSHVALVNTALNLSREEGPAAQRGR